MWNLYDNGNTLGTRGTEQGIIILDFEDKEIGRITLENCRNYYAITYGVYGELVDTIFGNEDDLRNVVEGLKIELNAFKYLPYNDDDDYTLCEDIVNRRDIDAPIFNKKREFKDFRAFSFNHFMIDLFPELQKKFLEYTDNNYSAGSYKVFSNVLLPYILEQLEKDNKVALTRFANFIEDISYSKDEYFFNLFYIGILEDIYYLDSGLRSKLLPYLLKNATKHYKLLESDFRSLSLNEDKPINLLMINAQFVVVD